MKPAHKPLHLNYLDGLRAFAALFVVCHHIAVQLDVAPAALPIWLRFPMRVLGYGHYAVDLFIVLSGFCLMLPVVRGNGRMKQTSGEFFLRRAWRILPAYYGALALSALLATLFLHEKTSTLWDLALPVTWKGLVTHLLLVHDAFGEKYTINYVFWSIAVEWRIYFLFPLLVFCWRRFGAEVTAATALLGSFVLYHLCVWLIDASLSAHYLGLFALGMYAAGISFSADDHWGRRLPWGWIALGATAAVLLLSKFHIYHGELAPEFITDYVVGLLSMAVLVLVSTNAQNPLYKALSYQPLVFIGTFAYSIYLVHAPILQIFWLSMPSLHASPWMFFAVLMFLGVPTILIVSYLFFLAFERPFLKTKIRLPAALIAKTAVEPAP